MIDLIVQGVADANEQAYLTHVCSTSISIIVTMSRKLNNAIDLDRIQNNTALGNSPLWFGGNIDCVRILSRLTFRSSLPRMGLVNRICGYR